MCGLVGVLSFGSFGIGYKEREIFENLLVADAVRGEDGTGVFIVDAKKEIRTLKKEYDPFSLFRDKQWTPFFSPPYLASAPKDLVLIGHNRAMSSGLISTKNAHPHRAGHITLVHNGTLQSHSDLPGIRTADVDSIALARGIAEMGVDEAISKTHGSYAVIYFNSEDGTLNIIRNAERPLFFCAEADKGRIFIASEIGMLKWILTRQGITGVTVSSLKVDTLMRIPIEHRVGELPTPEFRKIEGPKVRTLWRYPNWTDAFENEVEPIVHSVLPTRQRSLPALVQSKSSMKAETRILKSLKHQGLEAKVVQHFHNRKVGESLLIKICNFTESKDKQWPFTMEGENPLHLDVQFRFRLKTLAEVEEVMNHPEQMITIRRIMKFPAAREGELQFIVWVSDPEIWPPADTPELAEVILDPGNPAHEANNPEWKQRGLQEEALSDPDVVERLLH